ncbi:Serine/threonine-protein phosphatase PP2A catalytic subunit [Apiospora arundinis]
MAAASAASAAAAAMATADSDPGTPHGYLVPPWYQEQKPSLEEMNIISIIWGFSLACAGFTFVKATKQTWCCLYRWHRRRRHEQQRQQQEQHQPHSGPLRRTRSHRSSTGQSYYTRPTRVLILNGYLAMVWAEWLVSVAFGILAWFYLNPMLVVRGSFWVFFGFLCLWTVQMQCILQILMKQAVAIDFDIYSSHTNTTAGGGSFVVPGTTSTGTETGSSLPSYPPVVVRRNNSHNNNNIDTSYFDLELGLSIPPDADVDKKDPRQSESSRKESTEEDRSIMNEARRLGVATTNTSTNLRGGGGRPSAERHSSGSVLMKISSDSS